MKEELSLCWICGSLKPSENTIAVTLDDLYRDMRVCGDCLDGDLDELIEVGLVYQQARVDILKGLRQRFLASQREFYRAIVAGEVDRLQERGCTDSGVCRSFLCDLESTKGKHRDARLEWLEQFGMSPDEICDELNQAPLSCFETDIEQ